MNVLFNLIERVLIDIKCDLIKDLVFWKASCF